MGYSYPPYVAYRLVAAIDRGTPAVGIPLIKEHRIQGEALTRLVYEAAVLAAPRPGIVMVGDSVAVWGNPLRDANFSWRCGDCMWTGNNYKTLRGAKSGADKHASGEHPADARPAVTEIATGRARHARLIYLAAA